MSLFSILKNIFILLIILQVAPLLIIGIKKQYTAYLEPKAKIGLVSCEGFLSDSKDYVPFLNTLFKDKTIKGILIKMDCSGSATGTGQSIHNEIKTLKALYPKPVIVIVENICASGGYYIASAADYIVAPGMSLIGSIGTCFPYIFQAKDFLDTCKIKYVPLKAGTYKNATNPLAEMTEQDKNLLQEVLDDTYDQFVSDIAINRHLARAHASEWAEGKIFSGKQAKALGLIDMLGSMHDAITIMKKRALIEGEIELISNTKTQGLISWFCSAQQSSQASFGSFMDSVCNYLEKRYLTKVIASYPC